MPNLQQARKEDIKNFLVMRKLQFLEDRNFFTLMWKKKKAMSLKIRLYPKISK